MKKTTLFVALFCMIFSNLIYAQTENPYQDFNPESLKKNKDYTKNFAPNNFSTKILYNCMQDMVNAARAQYAYLPPMKTDIQLDSTAMMQAIYQAQKEEKTVENLPPYRTTEQRLKKYGLGTHGKELTSKAKATLGANEYTYYDVCLELIRPMLKNVKTAAVLLDRQYTYLGFGYEFDKYMKSIYASYILANDRTFNYGKPVGMPRDLPYTRTKLGLAGYDEQLCKKCMSERGLEILPECLSVKDGVVYFTHEDMKVIRKLIGKEGDAIVLDFVQHSQYNGDGTDQVDQDRPNHGFMSKTISYDQMVADNQATGKKTTKLFSPIAEVPQEIPDNADYDINIIIIKDGKYVCRDVLKKNVECKNADYKEPMYFLKDESTIKAAGEWVPVAETNEITVTIPFDDKKLDYTLDDIKAYFNELEEPAFVVEKVDLTACTSFNYSGNATTQKNQKRRAESMASALKKQFADNTFDVNIKYDDSWEMFKQDLVKHPEYSDLAVGTKEYALSQLKYNNGEIAKALENDYLKKERRAVIVLHIRYKVDGENEQPFTVTKFNRSLAAKNLPLAMAIQQYIMKEVEAGRYGASAVSGLEIPNQKNYQPLLSNRVYMQAILDKGVNNTTANAMLEVSKLSGATTTSTTVNQIAQYNKVMAEVAAAGPFADMMDITNRQANIDKLYGYSQLPQDKVNDLNLEFQFQIINYLKTAPSTTENVTLLENTYNKIKEIRNPVMSSWKNAYKLAAIFMRNNDFVYAVSLMEPFLRDESISNDFLFSFISISAVREELYMSGNFTLAVQMAQERDAARLCGLFDKLPVVIFDNQEVKKIIFKNCK